MSLCVAFQKYNELTIAVDTAISTQINGDTYRCTEESRDKVFVHNGDIYFVSGLVDISNLIKANILRQTEFNIDYIVALAKHLQEQLEQFKTEQIRNSEIGILIFRKDGNVYSLATQSDFKVTEFYREQNHVKPYTFGLNSEEAMELIDQYYKARMSPIDIINKVYADVACEAIGGHIRIFHLNYDTENIDGIEYKLDERNLDIKYSDNAVTEYISSEHCIFKGTIQANEYLDSSGKDMLENGKFKSDYLDLKGLNIVNPSGATTLSIDDNGININSGSINWNNVNTDPTATNAEIKANEAKDDLEALANGEYINGTFIDGTTVKAPEIIGGVIKGGRIESGSTIDVRTDANIGRKLIVNGDDFANGVEFHNKDGNKVAEIYIDPASGSMFIETTKGKIMLNGHEYSPYAVFA